MLSNRYFYIGLLAVIVHPVLAQHTIPPFGSAPMKVAIRVGAGMPLGPEDFGYDNVYRPYDNWTGLVSKSAGIDVAFSITPLLLFNGSIDYHLIDFDYESANEYWKETMDYIFSQDDFQHRGGWKISHPDEPEFSARDRQIT